MALLGVAIATYTGFLLSALIGKPLLNQPILPLLFLVSSLSAGVAANILLGLSLFGIQVIKRISNIYWHWTSG